MITDSLTTLKIHKFKTQKQYEQAKTQGKVSDSDVCLVPEELLSAGNTKNPVYFENGVPVACDIYIKHDFEANWLKATDFIPLKGEIIVYDAEIISIPEFDEPEIAELPDGRSEPYEYARFKIGDGLTTLKKLPFYGSNLFLNIKGGSIDGSLDISRHLNVNGHLSTKNLGIESALIELREGLPTPMLEQEEAGFYVHNYDGFTDGELVFDLSGTVRVGDVGDLQPLTTRDEEYNLTNKHLLMWDSEKVRLVDSGIAADISEGNETTPVYFKDGKPVACKTMPSITLKHWTEADMEV